MGELVDKPMRFTRRCVMYLLMGWIALHFQVFPYPQGQADMAGGIEPNPLNMQQDQFRRAIGTADVTVKKDGGLDISFILRLDARVESLAGGKIEELLTSRLQSAGIELHKTKNGKATEYQFLKSYASIEDIQFNAGSLDIVDTQVVIGNKWLYTRYDVVAQPKLSAYSDEIIDGAGMLSVPKSLVRLLLQSLALDFRLTLPYDLYGPNNAAEQEGNTLTWHVTLADSEPIRLVVNVPNVKNIVITAGSALLLLSAAVMLFIRRRKSHKPKAS